MILSNLNEAWLPYLKDIDIKTFAWPYSDEFWEEEIKTCILRVWLDGKVPRGFVVFRFTTEFHGEKFDKPVLHIRKLVVHPSWREKGIGLKLLENLEATAKMQGTKLIVIRVHEENESGRNWLVKRGFKAKGLHREVYLDGRDGYSFHKVIG